MRFNDNDSLWGFPPGGALFWRGFCAERLKIKVNEGTAGCITQYDGKRKSKRHDKMKPRGVVGGRESIDARWARTFVPEAHGLNATTVQPAKP